MRRRPVPMLLLAALLGVLGLVGPAGAHTQVQRAIPGPGETVGGNVTFVVLEFLDPVMPTPVIEVTGPDGRPVPGLGAAELIADDVARVGFAPLGAAGEYQVDYAFASLDGAPQEGAHRFTFEPDDGWDLDARRLAAALVGLVVLALVGSALVGRSR